MPGNYYIVAVTLEGYMAHKQNIELGINRSLDLGALIMKNLGKIAGQVKLQGQTNHEGTKIYIQGAPYQAITEPLLSYPQCYADAYPRRVKVFLTFTIRRLSSKMLQNLGRNGHSL